MLQTLRPDPNFHPLPRLAMEAAHQIRLQGGDCSTDSFCYPSA
jgi:methanethiol oxidase